MRANDSQVSPTAGSRLRRFALWAWFGLGLALVAKGIVEPRVHTVYPIFEDSVHQWLSEREMYFNRADDFRYAPLFTVMFTPLAILPAQVGSTLWNLLNVAAFFFAIQSLRRNVLPGTWTAGREGLYLFLVLVATLRMFWSGQSNPLVFALIAWSTVSVVRQRWLTAAMLLALAAHIKVWPLAYGLLLAAFWPRRFGLRLLLGVLGLAIVPFLAGPPSYVRGQYVSWFEHLADLTHLEYVHRDAWIIWELIRPPVNRLIYTGLQLSAAAAVLAFCWRQRSRTTTTQLLTWTLALWACWQMLFGPGIERATFGAIAPISVWALLTSFAQRRGRWVTTAAYAIMLASSFGALERLGMQFTSFALAAHPLGVILLLAWLLSCGRSAIAAASRPEQCQAARAESRQRSAISIPSADC